MSELRRKAAALVQQGKDAGVVGSEVLLRHSKAQTIRSHATPGHNEESSADLWVYQANGRVGHERLKSLDDDALQKAMARAIQAAGKASPDPLESPPDRMDITVRGLGIDDPRAAGIEDTDRAEVLSMNEGACRGISASILPGEFVYQESRTERCYGSSRGTEELEAATLFELTGTARLADRPDLEVVGAVRSRHFADVASVPLGVALGRRVQALEKMGQMPERELPFLFEPRVIGRLLPPIVPAFEASLVEQGKSFLADRLGESIGSEKLHVIDDATLHGALNTRAFDDRGIAPVPVPLIREGSAAGLYVGYREARSRQGRPTGHHRADGSLWPGNLVVRSGNRSRNMIFADIGKYIMIDDVLDTTGIDPVSGRVDVPVRVAVAEAGQVLGYVGVRRLVGTIESIFGKIVEMASDQERHGTVDACTWVLEGLNLEV